MAKNIMIQGTMSNVGKSIIAAALCRIFKQDGYKVAPFKSQNMALNSYVTGEGLEMGRAQVMQAEAAGIEPQALMNPILLKPTSDVGSQVIVNGEVVGNMRAMEYFRRKKEFVPQILEAYKKLDEEYDIIVIEGAGSPVEMNLKKDDIVNMGFAKLVNSPVLLVGDIDRGGVFAQLIGTLDLLEEDERKLVKGLVVNKFRGDINLFNDGIRILEDKGGKKVLGVVPYVDADIEEEDSLTDKFDNREAKLIDIVVIHLPKISNYTDFDIFSQYKNVSVRYVKKAEDFGTPDMVIIPGTKNTISDCMWLRKSGIEDKVRKFAEMGNPVFGICGGYQILGEMIEDPKNSEGGGRVPGMGLLPVHTVFEGEKTRKCIRAEFENISGIFSVLSGEEIEGYEIHMGRNEKKVADENRLLITDGEEGGCYKDNIYGSYIHGIFDNGKISEKIVRVLYEKKGYRYEEFEDVAIDRRKYKEEQFDKLAEEVRKSMDIGALYEIIFGKDLLQQ